MIITEEESIPENLKTDIGRKELTRRSSLILVARDQDYLYPLGAMGLVPLNLTTREYYIWVTMGVKPSKDQLRVIRDTVDKLSAAYGQLTCYIYPGSSFAKSWMRFLRFEYFPFEGDPNDWYIRRP